jgi:Tachylectin
LRAGAIVYAIRLDGTLEWYRHDGVSDGTSSWANGGLPKTVGSGWVAGHQRVFSGCNGIIYLIGDDGALSWYKHKGYLDGTFDWEGPSKVGDGWNNFHNVFSIGGGIIYAVDQDGTLWWYKHKGYQNGTTDWEDRKKVGDGWNANGFSIVCNSVYLKPTFLR